jgi:hypothetical protein
MSLVPAVSVAADKDNYGQYFCYAEHVAGIVQELYLTASQRDVQPTYSGKIQLRDNEMKFFLTLTHTTFSLFRRLSFNFKRWSKLPRAKSP